MPVQVECECGRTYRVPDSKRGERIRCNDCGAALRVPSGRGAKTRRPAGRRSKSRSEPPKWAPAAKYAGAVLLGLCFTSLAVGRVLLARFFPEKVGAGVDAEALMILVPIWGLGLSGLALLGVGAYFERRG